MKSSLVKSLASRLYSSSRHCTSKGVLPLPRAHRKMRVGSPRICGKRRGNWSVNLSTFVTPHYASICCCYSCTACQSALRHTDMSKTALEMTNPRPRTFVLLLSSSLLVIESMIVMYFFTCTPARCIISSVPNTLVQFHTS